MNKINITFYISLTLMLCTILISIYLSSISILSVLQVILLCSMIGLSANMISQNINLRKKLMKYEAISIKLSHDCRSKLVGIAEGVKLLKYNDQDHRYQQLHESIIFAANELLQQFNTDNQ